MHPSNLSQMRLFSIPLMMRLLILSTTPSLRSRFRLKVASRFLSMAINVLLLTTSTPISWCRTSSSPTSPPIAIMFWFTMSVVRAKVLTPCAVFVYSFIFDLFWPTQLSRISRSILGERSARGLHVLCVVISLVLWQGYSSFSYPWPLSQPGRSCRCLVSKQDACPEPLHP